MNPLVAINLEYERRLKASEERRMHLDLALDGQPFAQDGVEAIEHQIAKDILREYSLIAAAEFGAEGGRTRAVRMTPEKRREIAQNAGKAGGRGRPKGEDPMEITGELLLDDTTRVSVRYSLASNGREGRITTQNSQDTVALFRLFGGDEAVVLREHRGHWEARIDIWGPGKLGRAIRPSFKFRVTEILQGHHPALSTQL